MPASDNAKIHSELSALAAAYKDSGFGKLADRLTLFADSYKPAEPPKVEPVQVPAQVETPTPVQAEAKPEPVVEPTKEPSKPVEAKEVTAEEPASQTPAETASVEGDDSEDDDWEGLDDDDEDEESEEEVEATEDMDEDIAMRDACTKLCRAAKAMESHPNPNIRSLATRLNKVERLLRTTL